MLELMKKRRSIRRYSSEAVRPEQLQRMLHAALLAPTSMNKKPVECIVVDDKDMLQALAACKVHGASFLVKAALGIVVIADSELADVWIEDASIAAFAMQLEAEQQGLGSTWIQVRLRQNKEGVSSEQIVRELLDIPEKFGVVCILAVGHKDEEKAAYTEADADLNKVHTGRFVLR